HTEEASNGRQALDKLTANPPDCMLLDLTMPGMDGFDVLNVMKRKNLAVPVIVLTADIQDVVRDECLELGAAYVLHKPPRHDELLQALSAILQSV
ncbi:MAG: response regulator, partial [Chloroflexi bacterium]